MNIYQKIYEESEALANKMLEHCEGYPPYSVVAAGLTVLGTVHATYHDDPETKAAFVKVVEQFLQDIKDDRLGQEEH